MKLKRLYISILFFLGIIIALSLKVEAKSYYINDMDIQATVLENGDVQIEQTLEYTFDGSYNGVYITIPKELNDSDNKTISDKNYSATGVKVEKVGLIAKDGSLYEFRKESLANSGTNGVYTVESDFNSVKIKAFSPSKNESKKFKMVYVLENLCVLHNDVGELYYNFIGGKWECTIKNLNIDVYVPENKETLKIWGHGPDNGYSEIIDNTHSNFKVTNIPRGKYVAARVVFDRNIIPSAEKVYNDNAMDNILKEERGIARVSDAKKKTSYLIIIFALLLFVYWIYLLERFEKDKKYKFMYNEEELFEKYSPIYAGCLQGNRDVLSRDIIAEILYLIEEKFIELDIKPSHKKNRDYDYIIKRVEAKENLLKPEERKIYFWIFKDNILEVDLMDRLQKLPKDSRAVENFEELNNMVQNNLNKSGANMKTVNSKLRFFNNVLFIITVVVSVLHIMSRGLDIDEELIYASFELLLIMLFLLPFLLYIPIYFVMFLKKGISKVTNKYNNPKLVTRASLISILYLIIICLTLKFCGRTNRFLIADELLLWISTIIMFTDNLMMKNQIKVVKDYCNLNSIKEKIENYSLLKDRNVEYIELWDKYIAYAVSFGISEKIIKNIKDINDDSLMKLMLDNTFNNRYLRNDYRHFYVSDKRFLERYNKFSKGYAKVLGSVASSSGKGGGFTGGGGFSGGGGRGGRRRRFLEKENNFAILQNCFFSCFLGKSII